LRFLGLKKGKVDFFVWRFYGRFLSISIANTTPIMIITTIMAIAENMISDCVVAWLTGVEDGGAGVAAEPM
jgi:hypothetical protein